MRLMRHCRLVILGTHSKMNFVKVVTLEKLLRLGMVLVSIDDV
jgi:hypothetical protein